MKIKAIYENGVLRPLEKVDLEEKGEIELKIANAVTKTRGIIKVKPKIAKEIAESDELSVWGV
jgi:predicted DNA-binding antitoxin AbrB/MazE fold protein